MKEKSADLELWNISMITFWVPCLNDIPQLNDHTIKASNAKETFLI